MQTVAIVLRGQGDRRSTGDATVQVLTDLERWRRALRSSGLLALGAVLTLLIPIVHFFAPPVLLLTSVIVLVRRLGQRELLSSGGGPCPRCGERVDLEQAALAWPVETTCVHCRSGVRIERA